MNWEELTIHKPIEKLLADDSADKKKVETSTPDNKPQIVMSSDETKDHYRNKNAITSDESKENYSDNIAQSEDEEENSCRSRSLSYGCFQYPGLPSDCEDRKDNIENESSNSVVVKKMMDKESTD